MGETGEGEQRRADGGEAYSDEVGESSESKTGSWHCRRGMETSERKKANGEARAKRQGLGPSVGVRGQDERPHAPRSTGQLGAEDARQETGIVDSKRVFDTSCAQCASQKQARARARFLVSLPTESSSVLT